MKSSVTLLVLGLLGSSAWAQSAGDMTDATEILKKVDAAAKAVKSISYHAKFDADSPRGKFSVEGTVLLAKKTDTSPEKGRIEGKVTDREGKIRNLVVGSDGENYYLIDHDSKKVYVDIDPAVVGSSGGMVAALEMREFNHPTPFTDEINGEKKDIKGTVKVGDVDCYEIHVKYVGVPQEAVWSFGKADFLPRKRVNIFPVNGESPGGGSTHEVTHLALDPTFVQDPFKLVIPEGYTKIEDFAP